MMSSTPRAASARGWPSQARFSFTLALFGFLEVRYAYLSAGAVVASLGVHVPL